MPWKIKDSKIVGSEPFLWMHDISVNLNMKTELDTGTVHLYIGSPIANRASIYLTLCDDPEDTDTIQGVVVEHVRRPTLKQLQIIDSVLQTLKYDDRARTEILGDYWVGARQEEVYQRDQSRRQSRHDRGHGKRQATP